MKYLRGPETLRPTQYCNTPVWWFQGGSFQRILSSAVRPADMARGLGLLEKEGWSSIVYLSMGG